MSLVDLSVEVNLFMFNFQKDTQAGIKKGQVYYEIFVQKCLCESLYI